MNHLPNWASKNGHIILPKYAITIFLCTPLVIYVVYFPRAKEVYSAKNYNRFD